MEKPTRKSPLKDPPLRLPGESAGEQLERIFTDDWMPWFLVSLVFVVYAVLEWLRYFLNHPPQPGIMTIIAVLVLGYTVIRTYKVKERFRSLKQGMAGEKFVGQSLEELRSIGATVFHDVCAKDFNVDHVVVSPKGVFAIETKTYSKPVGKGATIRYDGVKLLVDGKAPDRDPVSQATANAKWVQELIMESTGKSFPVRPVVLFPGWFVETLNSRAHDKVWVLNPKSLPYFIKHEKAELPLEDLKLISFHLTRYIQSKAKE